MKKLLVLLLFLLIKLNSYAQCPIVVSSTKGYNVHIDVNITSMIVKPNGCGTGSCLCGYVYNYVLTYNITFSGTNIPSSLYTLQGTIYDDNGSSTYDLPNNGGSGTSISANVSTSQTNCSTVTYSYFHPCITVIIEGEGIPPYHVVPLTCPCTSTTPVELISFKGNVEGNYVQLKWSTAIELNNDYFILEKSNDAVNWNEIGRVSGNGTSSSLHNYSYLDTKPFSVNYYRLKQVDYNGDYEYSHIVNVNLLTITTYVYSNQPDVDVKVVSQSLSNVNFVLYDILGRIIYNENIPKPNIEMTHKLQMLNKQLYILKIVQDNYVIGTHKFIVE